MAQRKKLDTSPKTEGGVSNYPVPTSALPDSQFATLVRLIKRGGSGKVEQLKTTVAANMKRLRLRSKGIAPVAGVPDGSDQVDIQTIVVWANNIKKADKAAKQQLITLMATVRARLG